MKYLPLDTMIPRGIYLAWTRSLETLVVEDGVHLSAVVWTGSEFLGIRDKFDHRYVSDEFHWDSDPHFGTVKPIRYLEQVPDSLGLEYRYDHDLFTFLDNYRAP